MIDHVYSPSQRSKGERKKVLKYSSGKEVYGLSRSIITEGNSEEMGERIVFNILFKILLISWIYERQTTDPEVLLLFVSLAISFLEQGVLSKQQAAFPS